MVRDKRMIKMKRKFTLLVVYILVVSSCMVLSIKSNSNINSGTQSCDASGCHSDPGSKGHVDYSNDLAGTQGGPNSTQISLTATIKNNDYPFQTATLTLESSSEYTLSSGSSSINLGALGTGASKVVQWIITSKVLYNSTLNVTVDMSAFAYSSGHMQYTFTTNKTIEFNSGKVINATSTNSMTDTSLGNSQTTSDFVSSGVFIVMLCIVVAIGGVMINRTNNKIKGLSTIKLPTTSRASR